MLDYDKFEKAGHDITLIQGMLAGVSTYYCERCGALVQVGGPESKLILFHVPPGSLSNEKLCVRVHSNPADLSTTKARKALKARLARSDETLKAKLKKLQDESYERLRRAAEDSQEPLDLSY
jgi:hypothetical protein